MKDSDKSRTRIYVRTICEIYPLDINKIMLVKIHLPYSYTFFLFTCSLKYVNLIFIIIFF